MVQGPCASSVRCAPGARRSIVWKTSLENAPYESCSLSSNVEERARPRAQRRGACATQTTQAGAGRTVGPRCGRGRPRSACDSLIPGGLPPVPSVSADRLLSATVGAGGVTFRAVKLQRRDPEANARASAGIPATSVPVRSTVVPATVPPPAANRAATASGCGATSRAPSRLSTGATAGPVRSGRTW